MDDPGVSDLVSVFVPADLRKVSWRDDEKQDGANTHTHTHTSLTCLAVEAVHVQVLHHQHCTAGRVVQGQAWRWDTHCASGLNGLQPPSYSPSNISRACNTHTHTDSSLTHTHTHITSTVINYQKCLQWQVCICCKFLKSSSIIFYFWSASEHSMAQHTTAMSGYSSVGQQGTSDWQSTMCHTTAVLEVSSGLCFDNKGNENITQKIIK